MNHSSENLHSRHLRSRISLSETAGRMLEDDQTAENKQSDLGCPIESELKCGICMELFCKPAFFPCGHSICRLCHLNVDKTTETRTFTAPIFRCPLCREGTSLPWTERPINRVLDNFCKEKHTEEYLKLEKEQDKTISEESKRIADEIRVDIPENLLSLNLSQIASEARQHLADKIYKDLMIIFSNAALQGKSHISIVEKKWSKILRFA